MGLDGKFQSENRLPWWTWIVPLFICHIGTQLSLRFQFAPGVAILYLPIPLAMAMIYWWGPRVLVGLYLNAVFCAGLWGLPRWNLWPIYALPEMLAVLLAWILFEKIAQEKCWLPDLRATLLFIFFAILPTATIDGFQVPGQLVLLGDMSVGQFWGAAWGEWTAMFLACFAVTVPCLLFLTAPLERLRLTRTDGAQSPVLIPTTRFSWLVYLEIFLVFLFALILSVYLPVNRYWFLYAIITLWSALRFGIGMAALANMWIVFLTLILSAITSGAFGASWLPESSHIDIYIGLGVLCITSLVTGSTITTLRDELVARKRAEAEIRESQYFLDKVVNTSPNLIYIYDLIERRNVYANQETLEFLGYSPEQIRTEGSAIIASITHPEDLDKVARHHARFTSASDNDILELEYRLRDASGSWRWVKSRDILFARDIQGRAWQILGIAEDITQRKQLEEQFRQAQKMEAIGRLAGGIAHDFNNILVPIIGYVDLSMTTLAPDDKLYGYLTQVQKAANRAAKLTRQILAFSRKQVLEMQVLDLNKVVDDFRSMVNRLIGENIELETLLDPALHQVKADKGQIEQALLNLVVNACDAMPTGGKLIIETANVYLDEAYVQKYTDTQTPGHFVMLAVSDTGHGMDIKTQQHIFEPFFTTKPQGKGTGLGLATIFGIVKQHGGNIWVNSEVGKGATFKIYLPRAEKVVETADPATISLTSLYGTETILVVEDEEMVCKLVSETLTAYGYKVIEALNPNAGLQRASESKEPIHLLLTDLIMPEMNGRELYQNVATLYPDIKVLYMSGYTDNMVDNHGILDEGVNFLQKPFAVQNLTQRIRQVLS